MKSLYDRYWSAIRGRNRLKRAVMASFALHLIGVLAFAYAPKSRTPKAIPISFAVDLAAPPHPGPIADEPPKPAAAAPAPQITPPDPEPEPEKPKESTPPPPPKPVEKPKPEKKEPDKKPESKKDQVAKKPEPKPEPKKETPPKKTSPPKKEIVAKNEQPESDTGVSSRQELPTMLSAWARSLHRNVSRVWSVPGGIKVTKDGEEALVSFWVSRDGSLIGQPEILSEGPNRALAESGVRAVLAAAPFPPFPPDYKESEQQVIFGFSALR